MSGTLYLHIRSFSTLINSFAYFFFRLLGVSLALQPECAYRCP